MNTNYWTCALNKIKLHANQSKSVLKTNLTSNAPSSAKSVQWTAFSTLSLPNFALSELGSSFRAIYGSKGPQSCLSCYTACYCLTSKAIAGPEANWSTNLRDSGRKLYAS